MTPSRSAAARGRDRLRVVFAVSAAIFVLELIGGIITGSLALLADAGHGWWWADPLAAIAMCYFIVREGREAWEGEECVDP